MFLRKLVRYHFPSVKSEADHGCLMMMMMMTTTKMQSCMGKQRWYHRLLRLACSDSEVWNMVS